MFHTPQPLHNAHRWVLHNEYYNISIKRHREHNQQVCASATILHFRKGSSNPSATIRMDSLHSLKILSIIPYIIILVISATKIRKEYCFFSAGLFAFSLAVMSEFFAHFLIASMYSWAVLFLLIVFISFTEIIKTNDKKTWIILTVFSILCIYTHYFAAISAACIYLILLDHITKFEKDELER